MLRIGILVDSFRVEAWIGKIVDDIEGSDFARIEAVVLSGKVPEASSGRPKDLGHLLFNWYQAWDYRRHRVAPDALAQVDLCERLRDVPTVRTHPLRDRGTDGIAAEEMQEIGGFNLDVLFCFADLDIGGQWLEAARCGIWKLHHGEARSGPPLLREIREGNPVSGAVLQAFTSEHGQGAIIDSGTTATDGGSLYRNRNPIYWKTANYAIRRLRDLDRKGFPDQQPFDSGGECAVPQRAACKMPTTGQMMVFLAKQFSQAVSSKILAKPTRQEDPWLIAFRARTPGRKFDEAAGYRIIVSPQDRFYADPFLVDQEGKTFLFFEDYRYAERRGLISCAEIGPQGMIGEPIEVLRQPYHLSYPFIVRADGEIFMVPESSANRTVDLYRAVRFPCEWKHECTLLRDVNASDATIHISGGKYWMFVSLAEGAYSKNDELALFCADALTGPWTRHAGSPVVSDIRRARCGGPLFREGDRLIRPSQDCSVRYGYALVFSEVLLLNDLEYCETPIGRIDAGWLPGNLGTHHYSRSAHYEAIDGHRRFGNLYADCLPS